MLTILAQTTGDTATTSSGGNVVVTLALYAVIIGGLFYFLMIRPQRTRMKRHEAMMSEIAVGDEVQTIGGIYGRIEFMDETTAVLQVEGGGRLRVARRALAGKISE
ncbi:MAG TPA: preprotein translocase subunit YajC [Acidimicrobiia bacterium]|nr:preprotein translocase subunit YajC [Acidimicrobiia bacterium]